MDIEDASVRSMEERIRLTDQLVNPISGKKLNPMKKQIIMAAITALLHEIEPSEGGSLRQGLVRTPERVYKSILELYEGYDMDPKEILSTTFGGDDDVILQGYSQMVIVRDMPFYSQCEHHMIPFFGTAAIGYIPNDKVAGLSKLARLLECFARRLQVQERMSEQIAQTLMTELEPKGVMVLIKAEHLCMCARGVEKYGSQTITSAITGVFREPREGARQEFLTLVSMGR